MSWIQTYTGKQFWPLDPRAEHVDIADIAHSLSLQCRFNGHCRSFYSVAEHCVRVSEIVAAEHALWGLLHDAGEAYLADLPRPIKGRLDAYGRLEDRVLAKIAEAFGLSWPIPADVHRADDILLATESRDLMAAPPAPWGLREQPLAATIDPKPPEDAERAYLERFARLRG
ncbi:MAG: phosphohydrolase [Candidatus Schekmanbacteria bacterium]|nr:phosphohydrolase [Candidatus Schekmanbacteria bacterium]